MALLQTSAHTISAPSRSIAAQVSPRAADAGRVMDSGVSSSNSGGGPKRRSVIFERSGDFTGLFRRYDIHCAYVPADSIVASRLQRAGWTPVYRDSRWAVLSN